MPIGFREGLSGPHMASPVPGAVGAVPELVGPRTLAAISGAITSSCARNGSGASNRSLHCLLPSLNVHGTKRKADFVFSSRGASESGSKCLAQAKAALPFWINQSKFLISKDGKTYFNENHCFAYPILSGYLGNLNNSIIVHHLK